MRYLFAALALLCATSALGQTCPPASTVTPQPWNEARVSWTRPTTYSDNSPLPASVALTYVVYRRVGTSGAFSSVCSTTALATALPNQPTGQLFYTVTARTTTSPESAQPPADDKTVVEPAPNPPTGITVTSIRIEPDSWTCRDDTGQVLTRHERQDKAQESCTNYAIASLGREYEMRPSGFRIVAR